jgi:hypothetical protein
LAALFLLWIQNIACWTSAKVQYPKLTGQNNVILPTEGIYNKTLAYLAEFCLITPQIPKT